jgi:hypothetical protein
MLIAQRWHESVIVAARVLRVTRSALLMKDGFAELHASTVRVSGSCNGGSD